MSAAENIQPQPVEPVEQTAVVIPFPGVAQPTEVAPVDEVPADHWSKRLPAGHGRSVYATTWLIPTTVAAAIATGLVIRALNGGAL